MQYFPRTGMDLVHLKINNMTKIISRIIVGALLGGMAGIVTYWLADDKSLFCKVSTIVLAVVIFIIWMIGTSEDKSKKNPRFLPDQLGFFEIADETCFSPLRVQNEIDTKKLVLAPQSDATFYFNNQILIPKEWRSKKRIYFWKDSADRMYEWLPVVLTYSENCWHVERISYCSGYGAPDKVPKGFIVIVKTQ